MRRCDANTTHIESVKSADGRQGLSRGWTGGFGRRFVQRDPLNHNCVSCQESERHAGRFRSHRRSRGEPTVLDIPVQCSTRQVLPKTDSLNLRHNYVHIPSTNNVRAKTKQKQNLLWKGWCPRLRIWDVTSTWKFRLATCELVSQFPTSSFGLPAPVAHRGENHFQLQSVSSRRKNRLRQYI